MDKNKQIEEMANIIAFKAFEQSHLENGDDNLADIVAIELYDNGYRKASEVAEEIFAEIEKMLINEHIESFKALDDTWIHRFKESLFIELNKLKKKYTEGEGNERLHIKTL